MKYKDFKSALKFLEEYGFEYGLDSITNKRSCYRNFYGEIVLEYYRLDANDYIPQVYIEINGKIIKDDTISFINDDLDFDKTNSA